jgi:hypothetical protein
MHLDGETLKIALLLADAHNRESGLCCPSVAWMAGKVGRSRRQVSRYLAELRRAGCIEAIPRGETTPQYRFVGLSGGDISVMGGMTPACHGGDDTSVSSRTGSEPEEKPTPYGAEGFALRSPPRSAAKPSPAAVVFGEGVRLLGSTRGARGRIAGLRRKYGDDAMVAAIEATREQIEAHGPPADVSEYLEGVLRRQATTDHTSTASRIGHAVVGDDHAEVFGT